MWGVRGAFLKSNIPRYQYSKYTIYKEKAAKLEQDTCPLGKW